MGLIMVEAEIVAEFLAIIFLYGIRGPAIIGST
jgi:hypothetical protein